MDFFKAVLITLYLLCRSEGLRTSSGQAGVKSFYRCLQRVLKSVSLLLSDQLADGATCLPVRQGGGYIKNHFLESFVILFFIPVISFANQEDSLKERSASDFSYCLANNIDHYTIIDTSLSGFQMYQPVSKEWHSYNSYLGNTGAPYLPLAFDPYTPIGLDLGFHQFDPYIFKHEKTRYYNVKSPFTEVEYILGQKTEQVFNATHSQNATPFLNFTVAYQRITSIGFYQSQKTGTHNLSLAGDYTTRNNRYRLLGNFIFNSLAMQENGGVVPDTLFNSEIYLNRQIVPVNLQLAESKWNNKSILINQAWNMGTKKEIKINDSTMLQSIVPKYRLQHFFNYDQQTYRYIDQDTVPKYNYYGSSFLDSLQTTDSVHCNLISNKFRFSKVSFGDYDSSAQTDIEYFFEIKHDFFKINQSLYNNLYELNNLIEENIQNLILSLGINSHSGKQGFFYSLNTSYSLMDYNKDDYYVDGGIGYNLSPQIGKLSLLLTSQAKAPSFIASHFASNYFLWANNFDKVNIFSGGIAYTLFEKKLALEAKYYQINNFIYWNTEALPTQSDNTLSTYTISLKKDFAFKNIHFKNILTYQFLSDTSVIRLPTFWSKHSLYYENKIFKNTLHTQVGIDVQYNTDYFGNAYMPVTGQFYLQNQEVLSFYPVINTYINFQIKRVRIFILVANANQNISGNGYYAAFRYPMPDRALKVGISWRFYD